MAEETKDIFLSCFKCGRIVRSRDSECPRCGLKFGPGTLFECPFCSGLIWRNATQCSACGIDLTEFSESVLRTSSGFDMDSFVDNIINTELEQLKSTIRRVACPGCGLMIRGDEDKCPRCDLPLEEAKVDCPVCGEKIPISAKSCMSCQAVFEELPEVEVPSEMPSYELMNTEQEEMVQEPATESISIREEKPRRVRPRIKKLKPVGKKTPSKLKPIKKSSARPSKGKKKPAPKKMVRKPAKKVSKKPVKKKVPAKKSSSKSSKKPKAGAKSRKR